MHANRSLYSLTEYQSKLRRSYRNLGLVLEKIDGRSFSIFRPLPKTPWLPESRNKYFKPLFKKAKNIHNSKNYTLCTLTYSTRLYSPASACARIKHDIDLFFKRLDYHDKKPEYFLIVELTDRMMPHVHLVFNRYVHYTKVYMSWFEVTGNISTDIRNRNRNQAMHYCFKYLSKSKKQPHGKWAFLFKHIDRLWSSSRNFFGDIDPEEKQYKFLFMLWNKNGILNEYFLLPEVTEGPKNLTDNDISDLDYMTDKLDCKIRVGRSGNARQLAQLALAQPSQPLFSFYVNSIFWD